MKSYVIYQGIHMIVITEISSESCTVTIYENMAGRYVQLGSSERWRTADALEEYGVQRGQNNEAEQRQQA